MRRGFYLLRPRFEVFPTLRFRRITKTSVSNRFGVWSLATADDGRLDPAVVAALYLEHADELRAFLTGVLRDGDLAGDALQATFVKTMESGHKARKETLKGWLFRVAYNEAMLIRRRQQVDGRSIRKAAWTRPTVDHSPEDHAIRWEVVERVRETLESLPQEQRQIVRMRIYDEKTFAVIADELGIPLGTALTRMRLAMQKLSGKLESRE